jgi:chemotaxis protein methyltransferase CheR
MSAVALAGKSKSDVLVTSEYVLTRRNFENISNLLRAESGIHLVESKAMLVYSRLAKRLRASGCKDFDEYWELVHASTSKGAQERSAMFSALTTNLTRFFREPHHFEHMKANVMPRLAQKARSGARVRIWSSAASTGEEPYSIAFTVLEALPDAASLDVKILATDIDPVVLATASTGVYRGDVQSAVPAAMRDRFMTKDRAGSEGAWAVNAEVKQLISFKQMNLITNWPVKGPFDIIFCRNVCIYFEDETQASIWTKFHRVLSPDGRLYIGHSERIDVPGYATDGLTTYKKSGGV